MVYIDRRIQDFSRSRIRPRGTHPVSDTNWGITNTTIFQVIRIKFQIICRKITADHDVFHTDFLESFVPFFNSRMYGSLPLFRETIIHVEHDGLYRFHQFSPLVSLHIFRLHSPTIHQKSIFGSIRTGGHIFLHGIEKSYSRISQTFTHQILIR